jgi:hypothetical protein
MDHRTDFRGNNSSRLSSLFESNVLTCKSKVSVSFNASAVLNDVLVPFLRCEEHKCLLPVYSAQYIAIILYLYIVQIVATAVCLYKVFIVGLENWIHFTANEINELSHRSLRNKYRRNISTQSNTE